MKRSSRQRIYHYTVYCLWMPNMSFLCVCVLLHLWQLEIRQPQQTKRTWLHVGHVAPFFFHKFGPKCQMNPSIKSFPLNNISFTTKMWFSKVSCRWPCWALFAELKNTNTKYTELCRRDSQCALKTKIHFRTITVVYVVRKWGTGDLLTKHFFFIFSKPSSLADRIWDEVMPLFYLSS